MPGRSSIVGAAVDDLADRIYEASVLPELWTRVIAQIADSVAGEAALLSTVQMNTVRMVATSADFAETWQLIFKRFPGASNPRTQRLLAARHSGFVTDAHVFSPSEIAREPLYTEILVPRGYGSGAATAIHYPGGEAVVLNIERRAAHGTFDAAAIARLDGLRAHLARSSLISMRLLFERARTAVETISALGLAACAVTETGVVLVANPEFDAEADVWTSRGGDRIALLDRRADGLLQNALGLIATEQGVRSLPIVAGERSLPGVLHIVPIRRAAHDLFGRAAAILILTKASNEPTRATALLQALFDLTPTEAVVTARIAAGQTIEQIAHADGKSIATVRNQVKNVLGKTGCRRQTELARLLIQLIPAGS